MPAHPSLTYFGYLDGYQSSPFVLSSHCLLISAVRVRWGGHRSEALGLAFSLSGTTLTSRGILVLIKCSVASYGLDESSTHVHDPRHCARHIIHARTIHTLIPCNLYPRTYLHLSECRKRLTLRSPPRNQPLLSRSRSMGTAISIGARAMMRTLRLHRRRHRFGCNGHAAARDDEGEDGA